MYFTAVGTSLLALLIAWPSRFGQNVGVDLHQGVGSASRSRLDTHGHIGLTATEKKQTKMRFGKSIWGAFLLFSAIVLSSPISAHEKTLPVPSIAGAVAGHAEVVGVVADDCAPMDCDDCCSQHGKTDAPCSRSACCVGHFVSSVPMVDAGGRRSPKSSAIALWVSDQALPSTVGSPPYRPPCV